MFSFVVSLCLCFGNYRNIGAVFATFFELYCAVNQGEQGVVLAHTHVFAGVVYCAALANDDVAGYAFLTAENLNAQAFAFGFTTVT